MIFITEFESTYGGKSQKRYIESIPYWEERGQAEMGNMIGKSFGWKQRDVLSEMRHTLEIEAFPVDKWVDFKRKIATLIMNKCDELSEDVIKLLKELESYGTK